MHTLRFLLQTTKSDDYEINRRFYAYYKLYNIAVKYVRKRMTRLSRHVLYQQYRSEYILLLKQNTLNKSQRKRKNELSRLMTEIRTELGLTEGGIKSYLKHVHKKYKKLVSSQQAQTAAERVNKALENCLFKNGKQVHYKKFQDIHTIGGKSMKNGVYFDKNSMTIEWMKTIIPLKYDENNDYITESLDHTMKYIDIERKMFNNGYHYYAIFVIDDIAPKTLIPADTDITCGIDPGISTIAAVTEQAALLQELAPDYKHYNQQIQKLNVKIDRSLRLHNPNKYNPDGTYKKGNREKWIRTKQCRKWYNKRKTLYRKKSEYIRHAHNRICNRLIQMAGHFVVEDMDFKELAKRAKKTKRQETVSIINGKSIRKYKRKKRFGSSVTNRSPGLLLVLLEQKCKQYRLLYETADTKTIKASQFNHTTNTYEKIPLKQRWKQIDNHDVQRDLYSAFLLAHVNNTKNKIDINKCKNDFPVFLQIQNNLIIQMKEQNISMKQCFGF